jgi:serine/threonine protein phosphatase PrpC
VLSSSDSLDEQANALQAAALNNGGDDNITLVLAAFKF